MINKFKKYKCKYDYIVSFDELIKQNIVLTEIAPIEKKSSYIPFKYIQFADKSIIISFLPQWKGYALYYIKLFKHNLFSADKLNYLSIHSRNLSFQTKLSPIRNESIRIIYGIDDKNCLPEHKIQESTFEFFHNSGFINITNTYDLLTPYRPYFGTLIGNNIVSIVSTNLEIFKYPQNEIVDIGVGTHENYRKKGYAVSNIVAMAKYLLNNNYMVTYNCYINNINSQKTAFSSGLKEIAREYLYCVENH